MQKSDLIMYTTEDGLMKIEVTFDMDDIKKDPFEEYIKESEPGKKELGFAWYTAMGLQAVDGLRTYDYLKNIAISNIEGRISIEEAGKLIESYYEESTGKDAETNKEADIVSARIAAILSESSLAGKQRTEEPVSACPVAK